MNSTREKLKFILSVVALGVAIIAIFFLMVYFGRAKYVLVSEVEEIVPYKDAQILLSEIAISPDTWTNGNVTVTISTTKEGGTIYYRVGNDGLWQEYSTPFQVGENTEVFARLRYSDGWGPVTGRSIENIDKTPPVGVINSTNNLANSQTITLNMTDDSSGVDEYYWGTQNPSTETVTWVEYSQNNVTKTVNDSGTYYLGVKDAAGNVTVVNSAFYKTVLSANNGSSVSPDYVITSAGNSFELPTPADVTGYTFNGWWSLATGGIKVGDAGDSYIPGGSTTLHGQWTTNSYDITYDLDGGAVSTANPTTYTIESSAITLNNPTRTGYSFDGWTVGKNMFTGFVKGRALNSDTGVAYNNPTYGALSNYIEVDLINNEYYLSGLTDTLRSYVAGYNENKGFVGRTSGTERTNILLNNNSFIANGTAEGEIKYIRIYQYRHSVNTGTIDDVDNLQVQLEKGDKFTGYESHISTPSTSITIPAGSAGNRTYVANWTPNTYNIVYNGNGATSGSTAAQNNISYDQDVTLNENGFEKKYTVTYNYDGATDGNSQASADATSQFLGWTVGGPNLLKFSDLVDTTNTTVNSNGTLSFDVDNTGGSDLEYANFCFGKNDNIIVNTNYVYIADIKSKTLSDSQTPGRMTCSQENRNAQFDRDSKGLYNRYIKNGLNYVNLISDSDFSSSTFSLRTFDSVYAGYRVAMTFRPILIEGEYGDIDLYYYDEATARNLATSGTITLYSDWTDTPSVTLPTPTKAGYTFNGWYDVASGGNKIGDGGDEYTPSESKQLYAHWTANTNTPYTVNYYVHDLGATTYTLNSTDSTRVGTTDTNVQVSSLVKPIAGFTYEDAYITGNTTKPSSGAVTEASILGDGSRVINLYYRRNRLFVQYDMNGGSRRSTTSSNNNGYGYTGTLITNTNNTVGNSTTQFLRGLFGGKVGDVNLSTSTSSGNSGLHNVQNGSAIYISKTGYTPKSSGEWNTSTDGTGTSYNQTGTTYNANDFGGCDLSQGDQVVTLYVNWVDTIAPTKPTVAGFYNDNNTSYTANTWTNRAVYTTITSTDAGDGVNKIQYSTDNENWSDLTLAHSSGVQNSGTTFTGEELWALTNGFDSTLYFRAVDVKNNISEASDGFRIKYDTAGPSVIYTPDGNNTWATAQSLAVSVTDDYVDVDESSFKYLWTQSSTAPAENEITNSFLNGATIEKHEGSGNDWYLWVVVKDTLGNTTILGSRPFCLDNTAPVISAITNSSSGNWTNQDVNLSWTITEEHSGIDTVQMSLTGTGNWVDLAQADWNGITRTAEEDSTIYIRAIDAAGNISNVVNTRVKIDKSGPTNLSVGAWYGVNKNGQVYDNQWTNGNVYVELTGDDASGIQTWQWYEYGDWTTRALSTNDGVGKITFLSNRNTNIRFRAIDILGNTSEEVTLLIKQDLNNPTITVSLENASFAKSQSITITAADDRSGLASNNSYQYALSTSNETAPSSGWTNYTSGTATTIGTGLNGTYYLWVKQVSDNAGNKSAEGGTKVGNYHVYGSYVFDNTGPVASISSTNNLATSQTVTLSMSDSPAGVSQYYWGTSNPENETVTWVDYTENNVTQTVSDGGTYYFGVKDTLGNMTVVSKTFYKTTLTVNNGSSVSPAYVVTMEGNSFNLPTPSAVTGYTFSGWYTAATGGTKVGDSGDSYTPTTTATIQGQWTANEYTITYDYNGLKNYAHCPGSFSRSYNGGTNVLMKLGKMYVDDLELGDEIRISFDAAYTDITSVEGETAKFQLQCSGNVTSYSTELSTRIVREWTGTGTETCSITTTMTANKLTNDYFTMQIRTDNCQSGSIIISNVKVERITTQTATLTYGNTLGTLPNPSEVGYTLVGWYTEPTGGTQVTSSTLVPAANTTYYAHWTRDEYTISYNLDGGYNVVNPTTYNVESDEITLLNPVKPGYTFTGWTGSNGDTAQTEVIIPTDSTGNKSYTANWTKNTYTISYDLDGGSVASSNPASYSVDSSAITLNNPTKEGYTFSGWTETISNLSWNFGYISYETGNIVYSSTYTNSYFTAPIKLSAGKTYTISGYNSQNSGNYVRWRGYGLDGSYLGSVSNYNSYTPSQDCYVILLYHNSSSQSARENTVITVTPNDNIATIPTGSVGNRTYTANWTINQYTATFNANGGTTPIPTTVTRDYGTVLGGENQNLFTSNSTTPGYAYYSLSTNPMTKELVDDETSPSGKAVRITRTTAGTREAGYYYDSLGRLSEGQTYTIKFKAKGSGNWSIGHSQGGRNEISPTNEYVEYTKTFVADSNSSTRIVIYESGLANGAWIQFQPISITCTMPHITNDGYYFDGWWTAASGGTEVDEDSTMPAENPTYYAHWTARTYSVTLDNQSATTAGTGTMYYKYNTNKYYSDSETITEISSITVPEKTGYTFGGYYTSANGGGTKCIDENGDVIDSLYTYVGNRTLYAKWTANQYNIIYMSGNLLYGLSNCENIVSDHMTYGISNGVVTVTAAKDDGWGFTTGRTYLESGKTYVFSCETNGTWAQSDSQNGDTVEAFWLKDGAFVSGQTIRMGSNNNYEFTPTTSGIYWLRLDVNENEKTYTFSNISVYEKARTDTKDYGTTLGTLPTVSRTGYTLVGWYTDPTGGTEVTSSTPVPAENTTYYAHWMKNNYQNMTSLEYYETLADAFDEVEDGETIKVLDSVTETEAPELVQGISAVLDLNGKTTTLDEVALINRGTLDIYSSDGDGILQGSNNDRVINNYGTITTNDTSDTNEITIKSTSDLATEYVIVCNAGSYLILNDNTNITFDVDTTSSSNRLLIADNGNVTIDGATLTNSIGRGIKLGSNASKLTINSGYFETNDWNIYNARGRGSENSYAVTISGTDEGTVIRSTRGYAVYNANSGNNAQNVLISGGTMSTGTGMAAVYNGLGTTDITGGRIISGNSSYAIENYSTGTVNISGGYIYSSNKTAIYDRGNTCKLNVSGGTIIGANGIYNNGSTNTVSVTGGSITGTTGSGISSRTGTTTISGSTTSISGVTAGVYVTTGSLEVTGGTISASNGNGIKVDDSEGSVTIGSDDSSVSTVSPSITGTTYGVEIVDGAEFNFYDGVINGPVDGAISGDIADTPDDYVVVKTTSNSVESAKLYKEYDIEYDLDGGTVSSANPTTYTQASSAITLNNPTKTGYTFSGWTETITNLSWHEGFVTQETGEIVDSTTYPYSYYTDLIRVRSGEKITVEGFGDYYTRTSGIRIRVYNLNGEFYSGNHVMSLNAGGDYYVRVVFYRESTEAERNGTYISVTPNNNSVTIPNGCTGNRSYKANWTATNYNITYDLAGGTVATANPTTYTIESSDITLNNPSKGGYAFAGWTVGKNLLNYNNVGTIATGYGITVDSNGNISDSSPTTDARDWNNIAHYNWVMNLEPGTYTLSMTFSTQCNASTSAYALYKEGYGFIRGATNGELNNKDLETYTFTLDEASNIGIMVKAYQGVYKIQLEKGSEYTGFEPYIGTPNNNVTISTGSVGNRTYTANWSDVILKSGPEFNTIIKSMLSGVEEIVFTDIDSPSGTEVTDVSLYNNQAVVAWVDEDDPILYVSSRVSGQKIYGNSDCSNMFKDFCDVTSIDLDKLDTSNVTDMSRMFYYCSNVETLDLSGFDTSNVTNMSDMFEDCYDLLELDISSFNTSNVTDMQYMFYNAEGLEELDLRNFDTSNVTNMRGMFGEQDSVLDLNLSSFNTSKVTDMSEMFTYCYSTDIDVSSFDTSNVTNMYEMFYCCENVTSLDLSNFNTSKVTDMEEIFDSCDALEELDLSNFDTSNVTDMAYMFNGCESLTTLDVSTFDTSSATEMYYMFNGCSELTELDLSNFDTSSVTSMNGMFSGCSNLETIYASGSFDVKNVTNSTDMFKNCSNLVGGAGTEYNSVHIDKGYAHIDGGTANPGYFTARTVVLETGVDFKNHIPDTVTKVVFTTDRVPEGATTTDVSAAKNNSILSWIDGTTMYVTTSESGYVILGNENCKSMFSGKSNLTEIDFSNFVTFNTKNMSYMFCECSGLTGLDLSSFDTSSVTNMFDMFYKDVNIIELDLSNFDTSSVTDTRSMFYSCSNLETIYASTSFDVSFAITSSTMFKDCSKLVGGAGTTYNSSYTNKKYAIIDCGESNPGYFTGNYSLVSGNALNSIIPSNVTSVVFTNEKAPNGSTLTDVSEKGNGSIVSWVSGTTMYISTQDGNSKIFANEDSSSMFNNKNAITNIDFSNFDTSNVTNMQSMFNGCTGLTSIDVSGFNTSNVTNMSYMFSSCTGLTSLDVSKFNTSKVTNISYMFYNCNKLTNIDVSKFDTSNVTNMSYMFYGCTGLTSLDVSGFDTSNATNMGSMFYNCNKITSLDVSGFDTSNVTSMHYMFYNCNKLTSLDVSGFNTSKVTSMYYMFYNCNKLTYLDVSGFNTSKVTSMYYMFYNCSGLLYLDVSGFDTSNVTSMNYMFYYCNKLTSLDVSGFNTKKVTQMSYMFEYCSQLESLDLSSFDTSKVTDMKYMFYGCSKLKTVYASNKFVTTKVTVEANGNNMFTNCLQLVGGAGTVYNSLNIHKNYAHIDGLGGDPGYFTGKLGLESGSDFNNHIPSSVTKIVFTNEEAPSGVTLTDVSEAKNESIVAWTSGTTMYVSSQPENYSIIANSNCSGMFSGKSNLQIIEFNNFDASRVTNMSGMFENCSGLTSLNIGGFETDKVTNMSNMFKNCSSLETIIASYDVSGVTDSSDMFLGCTSLVGGAGTVYDSNHTDKVYAHIDGGVSDPGYFTANYRVLESGSDFNSHISSSTTKIIFTDIEAPSGATLTDVSAAQDDSIVSWMDDTTMYVSTQTKGFNVMGNSDCSSMFDDKRYLVEIDFNYFKTDLVTDMSNMFRNCFDLSKLDISDFNTSNVTDMQYMFYNVEELEELDLRNFDTSNVTNMSGMFGEQDGKLDLNLSSFNTSKVTNMYEMFTCYESTWLDLSSFDTSNVTNMSKMFDNCYELTNLDLRNFDTSNVTDMSEMFFSCSSLTKLDLGSFDTSKVTKMNGMFDGCSHLTWLNISSLNTSNVTNMNNMFWGCSELTNLDLSNFDTSNVTDTRYMFYNCYKLIAIYVSDNFVVSQVTDSTKMFYDSGSLVGGAGTVYDSSHTDKAYAHIDGGSSNPGYFSCKAVNLKKGSDFNTVLQANSPSAIVFENTTIPSGATLIDVSAENNGSVVAWMDGTTMRISATNSGAKIMANSDCNGMFDNDSGALDELVSIQFIDFDTSNVTDMSYMFSMCFGVTEFDLRGFDTSNVTDMSYMFSNCADTERFNLSSFDTSSVTDMSFMFEWCETVTDLNLSNFETPSLTVISHMFDHCTGVKNIDMRNVDTSEVTDTSYMFDNCTNLATLNIDGFDTENVITMNSMFRNCSSLTNIDLSQFDTSNVEYMTFMFSGCSGLTELDLSNFDTSNVTYMNGMFGSCNGLTELDLSSFDTSSVIHMGNMFSYSENLTTIIVGNNFVIDQVTTSTDMFTNCTSLIGGAGTIYDSTKVDKTYAHIDGGVSNPGYFTGMPVVLEAGSDFNDHIPSGVTSIVFTNIVPPSGVTLTDVSESGNNSVVAWKDGTTMYVTPRAGGAKIIANSDCSGMFESNSGLTSISFNNFDTSNVTDMSNMFSEASNLEDIDIDKFNTANVTNMSGMFWDVDGITELDLSNFDTSKVTDMSGMFGDCSSLDTINLSSFDTSNVTDMSSMFTNCRELTTIDLNRFNTGNVTDMSYMFDNCAGLTSLDLNNFDTSKVTDMRGMFSYCESLTTITVSTDFVVTQVTNSTYMFTGCTNLVGGAGTVYDSSKVDKTYAKIDRGSSNKGYFTNCLILETGTSFANHIPSTATRVVFTETVPPSGVSLTDLSKDRDNSIVGWLDGTTWYVSPRSGEGLIYANANSSKMFQYKYKLTEIVFDNLSTRKVTNMSYMFSGLSGIVSLDLSDLDTSSVTDMSYMFSNNSKLESIDFTGFNTSKVTNMEGMFYYCSALTSLELSEFDTSKVTNMKCMFSSCNNITSLDLSGFDTSNVSDMSQMFYYCYGLTSLNLNGFNTSNVTDMSNMFGVCQKLTSLDLSGFDTSNVMYMYYMFSSCSELTSLDVTGFNTSKVTNMSYMFNSCSKLTSLNLSEFDTSKVTTMMNMFYDCYGLTSLDISGFDTSNVVYMNNMFYNCSKLTSLDVSGFDTSKVTNMNYMFYSCSKLTSLDLRGFNTSNVVNMEYMFCNCNKLTYVDVSEFDTSNVRNMSSMFYYCSELTNLDVSGFNTSNVTKMSGMFYSCSKLTTLDVSGFDTSNVTAMDNMFYNCSRVTNLDVSGFDTSKVTTMYYMFNYCLGLTSLDVSGFNTSNVTNMQSMFSGCTGLTSLDVSGFDTSKVTNLSSMFNGCTNLTTIYVSNLFNTDKATSSSAMFISCRNLVGGAGTVYTSSKVDKTYAKIDEGTSNPGYFSYLASTYTIHFDSNGGSGTMSDEVFTGSEQKALTSNSFTSPTAQHIFVEWNTRADGTGKSYSDGEEVRGIAISDNEVITLYAIWKNVYIQYSHTHNIDDNGVPSGTYDANLSINDIVTLDGAESLNIEVWFSTQSATYDWLAIYPDGVTPTASNYSSATVSGGKLGGGTSIAKPADDDLTYHRTFTVTGDTVQFYFKSNDDNNYYGYYAIITRDGYEELNQLNIPLMTSSLLTTNQLLFDGDGEAELRVLAMTRDIVDGNTAEGNVVEEMMKQNEEIKENTEANETEDVLPTYPIKIEFDGNEATETDKGTKLIDEDGNKINTGLKVIEDVEDEGNSETGIEVEMPENKFVRIEEDEEVIKEYTFIGWFDKDYKDSPLKFWYDENEEEFKELFGGFDEEKLWAYYLERVEEESKKPESEREEIIIGQYEVGKKYRFTENTKLYAGWVLTKVTQKPKQQEQQQQVIEETVEPVQESVQEENNVIEPEVQEDVKEEATEELPNTDDK